MPHRKCRSAGWTDRRAPSYGLGHRLVHGWHPGKDRHLLALDQFQHLDWVELAHQDCGSAEDYLRQRVDQQATGMKHRKYVQVNIMMGDIVYDGVERIPGDHAV